ncbi:hypothetical protein KXQ82_18445 [Mucilaginibacter sp. HMF5004]|uniref:hypothetical protein n=1 Tax=Mucilaginibacter rivuli TaxID=2857527 RepID=UPI001C5EF03C|nr:hypothetical protein [Mucilaginibacter rivuli]MBW4891711.1 hypothetical protein [Mucilaginibacter rivuli]
MKTSTKLLIVFFIAIPTTLFAYNWLMKEQYLAGNLIPQAQRPADEYANAEAYVTLPLPQCKYVVVSGQITSGDFEHGDYRSVYSQERDIDIRGDHAGKQLAKVNKYYESLFKTSVVKDTLYISFFRKKHVENISGTGNNGLLCLYLNKDVEYIRTEFAQYHTDGSFNLKQMNIVALDGTSMSINHLQTEQLNLIAKGEAQVMVKYAKNIAQLSYSLLDSPTVKFNHCQVAAYKPLRIDSGAHMDITLKGNSIQQYLATKH